MSEWIKVEDELPEILSETHASEDVLVYCLSLEKTSFEKGEKYFAIDCMCQWNDGIPSSFRTDEFYHAKVLYWKKLTPPKDQ